MQSTQRRKEIIRILQNSLNAVNASILAERMEVSRQVIVGDIALLRAQGWDILSTPRGYVIPAKPEKNETIFTVACQHPIHMMRDELYIIVDHGGRILDVIVEHPLYGQLVGQLNLASRFDVDDFVKKIEADQVSLLSDLTQGIHLHTISCESIQKARQIEDALATAHILLEVD